MNNFQATNKAVDEVKANNKAHYNSIFNFASNWVKNQFKSFTSENLKSDYYKAGFEPPTECRVFGAVFRELSKSGLIFKHGFELSKNPICHSRPMQSWYSLEFIKKQQSNRLKKHETLNLF